MQVVEVVQVEMEVHVALEELEVVEMVQFMIIVPPTVQVVLILAEVEVVEMRDQLQTHLVVQELLY
jgi:hypothetical protein